MTEEELEVAADRHAKRRARFQLEGMSPEDAWELAEKMFDRDLDPQDDRRLCFECQNYNDKTTHCMSYKDAVGKTWRPLRFILQRCDEFKLRGKK